MTDNNQWDYIVLCVGGNSLQNKEGRRISTPAKVVQEIKHLGQTLVNHTKKQVFVLGLYPKGQNSHENKCYNIMAARTNNRLESWCKGESKFTFVQFRDLFKLAKRHMSIAFSTDMVHLKPASYYRMAYLLAKAINKLED